MNPSDPQKKRRGSWRVKLDELCELYGGIGSQHKALTNLGVQISEHYLVEVDINATISYAAIHCDLNSHLDDEVPSDSDMIEYLRQFNFWSNEKPYDVAKLPKVKLKTLYLAQQLSNNLGDVYQLDDLPPVDLITWSTPCQDFSNAGLKKGFDGTKGGLTFITLELFRKLSHKPTFLLFENVPMIVSEVFRDGFNRMLIELDELGYENIVMKLNAKDYGIPQNRDRVFVLSIRKDYHANYSSPKPIDLQLRLKDMLQEQVDERYYLSDIQMKQLQDAKFENKNEEPTIAAPINSREYHGFQDISPTLCARDYKDPKWVYIPEDNKKGYCEVYEGDGVYIDRPHQKRGTVQKGMIQTLSTQPQNDLGVIVPFGSYYTWQNNQGEINTQCNRAANENGSALTIATTESGKVLENNLRIRKLTPLETWRLMGFTDDDFAKAEQHHSNSALYKQAGNSIVVQVLEHILKGVFHEPDTV
jgi:DNA (cytosine-5)-methyltransferase 1